MWLISGNTKYTESLDRKTSWEVTTWKTKKMEDGKNWLQLASVLVG
jgi:hypothetical protein